MCVHTISVYIPSFAALRLPRQRRRSPVSLVPTFITPYGVLPFGGIVQSGVEGRVPVILVHGRTRPR
jgi:hypothetical protein